MKVERRVTAVTGSPMPGLHYATLECGHTTVFRTVTTTTTTTTAGPTWPEWADCIPCTSRANFQLGLLGFTPSWDGKRADGGEACT